MRVSALLVHTDGTWETQSDGRDGGASTIGDAIGPQEWRLSLPEIERDSDRDGWSDIEEARLGLDPHNPDSDIDGIPDGSDVCPNYAQTSADGKMKRSACCNARCSRPSA
jgi:hypothetical protein